MSTVRVANIQHPSAATAAITLDAAGGALIGGQAAYARNLLYNGAMQVAQRGTSTASITTSGYYTADRWKMVVGSLGTWTQSVENDAPVGSGFRKSLKVLCTTADAAPAASDLLLLTQALEGQDVQRAAKGTASAQQMTLSFWVKSNVTGTYVAELFDADNGREAGAAYTISASATWEKKTITFPADATGTLDNDNASSLVAQFWLGAGTDYTSGTLGTAWGTTTANRAVGQTNLAAATNNYWQITGVQLEVGPAATPFEFKSFGQELAECQRYFAVITSNSTSGEFGFATGFQTNTTSAVFILQTPASMRAIPTVTISNLGVSDQIATTNAATLSSGGLTPNGGLISVTYSAFGAQYRPCVLVSRNTFVGQLTFASEL